MAALDEPVRADSVYVWRVLRSAFQRIRLCIKLNELRRAILFIGMIYRHASVLADWRFYSLGVGVQRQGSALEVKED